MKHLRFVSFGALGFRVQGVGLVEHVSFHVLCGVEFLQSERGSFIELAWLVRPPASLEPASGTSIIIINEASCDEIQSPADVM